MLSYQKYTFLIFGTLSVVAILSRAQDYDDEGYGNQDVGGKGDDNYGNDDGYNTGATNNQQEVDSDASSSASSPSSQDGNEVDGDYEGDDGSSAALEPVEHNRLRRSIDGQQDGFEPKVRVKRHQKYYIGPVHTYVKTDKKANFKWGVKHKVGKKHHG